MNTKKAYLYLTLFSCAAAWVVLYPPPALSEVSAAARRDAARRPSLLNPLIKIRKERARIIHLQDLRTRLLDLLSQSGKLKHAAVYVEDLTSGAHMGIDEKEEFHLTSLLKLGLMAAWMKWDEERPGVLEKKIKVTEKHVRVNDSFSRRTDSPLALGEYRAIELIEKMIVSSDNTAANALRLNIPADFITDFYTDLALLNPYDMPTTDSVAAGGKLSARQYSRIFKAFYNASYLDEAHSELALRILTQSRFPYGLRAVIPKGIPAALKYGVYTTALYESGIVYYKDNPYLVSVFAHHYASDDAAESPILLIRELGGIIQDYFEKAIEQFGGK